ncbi:tyrosine-type recombinase/integrase [Rhodocytophaga aerolata]|uniref:Tyrosine-type recombinase/integrase n=1 Tax=Rhodocytophaga aerolata TaxID=455078 RepID=A0ABT8R890_9BACT|nr:tyrosine-type recombinase/integrase [Rhodocytophaga aerolata]MDO1447418.1 tyrosine-type recombinase/integrase [Rhodocytophaga aerolata]
MDSFHEIISGKLKIEDNFPVSVKSKFADTVWDFSNENKPRNLSINKSKQLIDWGTSGFILPETIMYEVKIVAFFHAQCPRVISNRSRVINHGLKPNTYCPAFKKLLQFLTHLYKNCENNNFFKHSKFETNENGRRIQSIYDITIHSLNEAAQSFYSERQNDIKKLLMLFNNPIIQQQIATRNPRDKRLGWNKNDINNLCFKIQPSVEPGDSKGYSDKPISDKLFQLLVKGSTADLLSFLRRMKIPLSSNYNLSIEHDIESNFIYSSLTNLGSMFKDYSEIKAKDFSYMSMSNKRGSGSQNQRELFKRTYTLSVNEFKIILQRVQLAAQYLLLQFTGIRYSEAVQLKRGCIEQLDSGDYVIRGTMVKGKPDDRLTNIDYWVACPIVRDAVSVLELMARLNNNDYLFAPNRLVVLNIDNRPLSNNSISNGITSYIHIVDTDNNFSYKNNSAKKRYQNVYAKYQLTTHRLRHTLSLQLYKAAVGIPYISFHLKHLYESHNRFRTASEVTLGYGGISTEIFNDAVAINRVNKDIINSLYHPEAPVAGPNAEEFKQRREDFFKGWQAAGVPIEEVMEDLVSKGIPFVDVGLGFCGGKRKIEYADGTVEEPPCKGNLQCNPTKCKNAIITKMHIPIWKDVYVKNKKKLNDPYMAYAKKEIQAIVTEAENVLKNLGIKLIT